MARQDDSQDDKRDTLDNEERRAFLLGAGLAAGASVAAGAGLPTEALAQGAAKGAAHAHTPSIRGYGAFLNDDDTATVEAIAERIMPGAPGKPGATECAVVNYIDLALSGAYSDLRELYRNGLLALEAYCQKTHKRTFARLTPAQQDATLAAIEQGKASEFTWPSQQAFFNTLRTHTMEGMFADPVYGGNRDYAGWRLVGFPGAQPSFTAQDMASPRAFTREPITGLQGQAPRNRVTRKG